MQQLSNLFLWKRNIFWKKVWPSPGNLASTHILQKLLCQIILQKTVPWDPKWKLSSLRPMSWLNLTSKIGPFWAIKTGQRQKTSLSILPSFWVLIMNRKVCFADLKQIKTAQCTPLFSYHNMARYKLDITEMGRYPNFGLELCSKNITNKSPMLWD